jgi:hypothetical protein
MIRLEEESTSSDSPLAASKGFLEGTQIQPRYIAEECYKLGWTDADKLVTMVATILSESQGFDRAYNDNMNDAGEVTSRDVGIGQINIPASKIGTSEEEQLYDWKYNLSRCRALYLTKVNTAGDIRGFQPWYGWVLKVYLRDTYVKKATAGVGNFLAERLFARETDTLSGQSYEHSLQIPLLDYRYRLVGMQTQFDAGIRKAYELKRNVTSPANKTRCDDLAKILSVGKSWGSK